MPQQTPKSLIMCSFHPIFNLRQSVRPILMHATSNFGRPNLKLWKSPKALISRLLFFLEKKFPNNYLSSMVIFVAANSSNQSVYFSVMKKAYNFFTLSKTFQQLVPIPY